MMAGKNEIIEAIAAATNLARRDAAAAYDAFLNAVTAALQSGEKVNVAGLGAFSVSDRAERAGRNPKTGEAITIPATRAVKFKPGKELKESVNSRTSA
jgi:DNA-binding protein HU-beta